MVYNSNMERIKTLIIGGGAAGLYLANSLAKPQETLLIERGERLGRKLSSTGNGQGNLTNLGVLNAEYFSVQKNPQASARIQKLLTAFDQESMIEFFKTIGVLTIADERGRVYPSSRQASALTDALRFSLERKGVRTRLSTQAISLRKKGGMYEITVKDKEGETDTLFAENVVLCAGGKAAKNFGTDGTSYALAQDFGHTLTALYPSLVQLKTDVTHTKTLKGIRVNNGVATVQTPKRTQSFQGDIIFTDYGSVN